MTVPATATPPSPSPSPWVQRWAHLIAPGASVLDLACGRGRNALWLAARGHAVTGVDRDAAALESLRGRAEVIVADIEGGPWPLAQRRFGAVVVTHYLWRPLWPRILDTIEPGGLLIYETFASGQQALGRPSRSDFLLRHGELLEVCAGLRIVAYEDGLEQRDAAAAPCCIQRIAAVAAPAGDGTPWPHRLGG
ncbi:MAG: class I SAM-dependent methyltransferase [Burkholderiales bacterium]|nr:class I SAM-dependent methyltransferase [Burkholderiales bacterium]